jgi:hypothetical protein
MTAARTSSPPVGWPYQPRTPLSPWAQSENLDLGPYGKGWTCWGPEGLRWQGERQPLGEAYGRGGVARVGEMVVRPYRRGGLVRHFNEATYLSAERFRSEADMHRLLWEAGLPTVEPLGCAWRRRGLGVEGLYLTRWTDAKPWPKCFEIEVWDEVERIIDALSLWECWVPDLNATNLLIPPEGPVMVLDFDRARFQSGDLKAAYRARLLRSLKKLKAPEALLARLEPRP